MGQERLAMVETRRGFLVPQPVNGFDGKVPGLRDYCPGITVRMDRPLRNAAEALYGPFIDVGVGHARDATIRFRGSSGGCLTAIACDLLRRKVIDGVLQVGASDEHPTRTVPVLSRTVEEVIACAGSRYAPSSLLVDLRGILERQRCIAVIGKPCDIVAVRQFLAGNPQYREKVYCTLSFFCMGLPSQQATTRLLTHLGIGSAAEVGALHYRGKGWPGSATVLTREGEQRQCSYDESWGRILGRDLLFRCKICPDGWGGFADISAGDAWFSDGQKPLFDERPGRSLLFVRTCRGAEILRNSVAAVEMEPYDLAELPIIQKSQVARKKRAWIAYSVLKMGGDRLLRFRGLGIWKQVSASSPLTVLREAVGFWRRWRRLRRMGH